MNGTDLGPRVFESIAGHNNMTDQFGWLGLLGNPLHPNHPFEDIPSSTLRKRLPLTRQMKDSNKLQSKRLVIMSSTIKLKISLLSRQLPQKVISGLIV